VDIDIVFLNLDLEKEIYIEIPDFFEFVCPNITRENSYIRLRKSFYKLKQVLRVWLNEIKKYFIKIRLKGGNSNPNFFISKRVYILLYIDNILIISPKP
jgi:hypothetical protein